MKHRTFWIFFLMALFATADTEIFAQAQAVKLHYSGKGGYSLVERTNLRRYVNGKYVGLTSREVRSFVSPSEPPLMRFKAKGSVYENDQWYDGSFYVMEETLRNSQVAGAGIHEAVQSVFHISKNGQLTMYKDNGYPSFRSFPAYTAEKVSFGESWKAVAERSVDPLNKGVFTKIPMQVLYTFSGAETYKGQAVYRIKAIWQTYYDAQNRDFGGDSSLQKARGGHKADIIVLQETGEPILTIDNVDETFFWIDGTQVNFKGTITLFTEFPPAFDSQRIMAALNRVATVKDGKTGTDKKFSGTEKSVSGGTVAGSGKLTASDKKTGADAVKTEKFVPDGIFDNFDKNETVAKNTKNTVSSGKTVLEKVDDVLPKNNIVAEEVSAGIRLSIRDIKFAPDSAQILSGESERLDEIAEVLKMAPNAQLLVEGHTASVGKPAGEQKLSEQRAHKIAEELKARGVKAGAFICRGFGGTKPVASNETNEGRAQNRRVEITILK
ncbi:MAG: OmpA family protein [Treponema berlinense]|uniref:OmpA family protein n=1 Tax=Treponema berlinense TaxID=225004 RepID=UPI002A8256EC|nr:OmpA family protein [Treponema berlinense]MDY3707399.1 OmpA family protein [Treponema berlinense]